MLFHLIVAGGHRFWSRWNYELPCIGYHQVSHEATYYLIKPAFIELKTTTTQRIKRQNRLSSANTRLVMISTPFLFIFYPLSNNWEKLLNEWTVERPWSMGCLLVWSLWTLATFYKSKCLLPRVFHMNFPKDIISCRASGNWALLLFWILFGCKQEHNQFLSWSSQILMIKGHRST